jgi:hypothetical protein
MRELFQRLRDEELQRVPSFRSAAATPPLSKRRWSAALRYAVVVIAIAVVVALHHHRPPAAESIVTWKAPTDFLLRTPGGEVLSTVPQIPERR